MVQYPRVMSAIVLDGRLVGKDIREKLVPRVLHLTEKGHKPGLAVILAGNDPASEIYVRSKIKASEELGIASFHFTPAASASTEELLALIDRLNRDPKVSGILVQMPLP